jgi:hypothetical protein
MHDDHHWVLLQTPSFSFSCGRRALPSFLHFLFALHPRVARQTQLSPPFVCISSSAMRLTTQLGFFIFVRLSGNPAFIV